LYIDQTPPPHASLRVGFLHIKPCIFGIRYEHEDTDFPQNFYVFHMVSYVQATSWIMDSVNVDDVVTKGIYVSCSRPGWG